MKKYPINGDPVITNYFRSDKFNPHTGIDFAIPHRTAIFAVANGSVISAIKDERRNWLANTGSDPFKPMGFPMVKRRLKTEDYGNYVKIDHGSDFSSLYAHLDEVVAFPGQIVKEGELIGYSDNTGNSTGNHLHYEFRRYNRCMDPLAFYNKYPDFEGKGGIEIEANFYEYKAVVKVLPEVDILYVRSGPSTIFDLTGSRRLKKNDEVEVVGFVKGERIEYGEAVGTQFWWKSAKGNYFWAGGTDLIPTLDNFPEGMKNVKNLQKEILMEELKQVISDLEVRSEEIAALLAAKETELEGVAASLEEKKAELEKATAEADAGTPEEAVEEAVEEEVPAEEAPAVEPEKVEEAPVEEAKAEEEPAEDPEKTEARKLIDDIRAKFGL